LTTSFEKDVEWAAPILRRELFHHAETIIGLAAKISELTDYPTETPRKVCALISGLAEVVKRHLPQSPSDQLRHVGVMLCQWTEQLRFVERARTADTPWSMIPAAQGFLRQVTGADASFVVRPQWSYNYQIGEFTRPLQKNMQALWWIPEEAYGDLFATNAAIYCLSFPRIERLNVTLHANWGHEIGHVIAREWIDQRFQAFWSPIETELRTDLYERAGIDISAASPSQEKDLQRVAEAVKERLHIAEKALVELIADAVGVYLLGPAAVLAASEYAARFDLDISPLQGRNYPPWRYRLRRMREQCDDDVSEITRDLGGEAEFTQFVAFFEQLSAIVDEKDDVQVLSEYPQTDVPYKAINAAWPRIREEALDILRARVTQRYRLAERKEIVKQIAQKLESKIPPNELGAYGSSQPTRFEDLINGGWLHKLRMPIRGTGELEDIDTLHRLLLKAIESAFVYSVYADRLKALETS
jgi:hypothetical protein